MADYIAIEAKSYDYTAEIHVRSAFIPDALHAILRRGEPFDIWWLRTTDVEGHYKIIAKVRYSDFRINRGSLVESWSLKPDPSASFKVDEGVHGAATIDFEPTSPDEAYHSVGDKLRLRLQSSVNSLFGISLGGLSGRKLPLALPALDESIIKDSKIELSKLLLNPMTSRVFRRKEDVGTMLSGIGCALFDALERKGIDYAVAFAAARSLDPLISLGTSFRAKPKNPKEFTPLSQESITSRSFSHPALSTSSINKTQIAEEKHQEIVRRLYAQISQLSKYDLMFNEFIDLALLPSGLNSGPRHILEIKSLNAENIESQIEKGVIQLARMQFYFGATTVYYHLILEQAGAAPDDWLNAIVNRMGINLHYFDLEKNGDEACRSIIKAIS